MGKLSLLAVSLLLVFTVGTPEAVADKVQDLTPIERIENLYHRGTIGRIQCLAYLKDLLTEPHSLPSEILGEHSRPLKCGTGIAVKILRSLEYIPLRARPDFLELLTRVDKQRYFDTPGGNFRIHYDTSGAHAVYQPEIDEDPPDGHPDYVNRCGEYFERAWAFLLDTLGYDAPPSDGTNGGGVNLYDVYLHHYSGVYGVTFPESHSDQYPNRPGCYTSYIYCDPTYEGFGYPDPLLPLQVTSAHEFFHAVQFAYNLYTGVWWMENSSTWMEDVIWDEVNDNYLYLPWFFQFPHLSLLTENGAHEYGQFVWAQFLYQSLGHELIRTAWEYAINLQAYYALSAALLNFASTFDEEFEEFSLWNYITGDRDDGLHYEEGVNYPKITIMRTHGSYPVEGQISNPDPEGLGCSYVTFQSTGVAKHLLVHFDGGDEASWGANIIGAKSGNQYDFLDLPVNSYGYGYAFLEDFQDYESAIMIPAVLTPDTYSYPFGYSAHLDSTVHAMEEVPWGSLPGDFSLMQNFPNPFNTRTVIGYQLPILSAVRLEVYNLLGEKVVTLVEGIKQAGYRTTVWDADRLPSGIYLYKLTAGNHSRTRTMMLVR